MLKFYLALGGLLLIFLILAAYFFPLTTPKEASKVSTPPTTRTSGIINAFEQESAYYYPMTNYSDRITVREFGKKVNVSDTKNLPCGSQFSGLHDADDLEILRGEETSDVPVYAVVEGKISRKESVSGYGGLLVQTAELEGEPVTIYYGHVDLGSVKKNVGDTVMAGEQLAILGEGCSAETDGERKHLHFAIKKGTGVDVRGYVPSADVLAGWLNPASTLNSVGASAPPSN